MRLLYSFIFLTLSLPALAQRVQRGTVPLAGVTVLSEVPDPFDATIASLEAPVPDGDADKARLRAAKAAVRAMYPPRDGYAASGSQRTTAAALPVVSAGFIADSTSGIPPDNYMAISKTGKAVSVVNSNIAVLDAATGARLQRKALSTFTSGLGLSGPNNYRYDPKVLYDAVADRFFAVVLNGVDQYNHILVGFSQTSDPAGAWNFYKFYGNYAADTTWFDYPTVAQTATEFFLTGNKIRFDGSWQAGFTQSVIYQFNKASGYRGDSVLSYQLWDGINYGGRPIRNLFPVKSRYNTGVQSLFEGGPEQYFLSNRNFDVTNDTIFLVRLPDTIGSGATTLDIRVLKSDLPYGVPPNGRQPGTHYQLATNDGRILGATRAGADIQFVSATSHSGGSAAIYHGRIQGFAGASPGVSARLFAVDSLDFGYPNISGASLSKSGAESIITFNYTGPRTPPGVGALFYDGAALSDMLVVKAGDSSLVRIPSDTVQRWGDYTGSQPDPSRRGAVWVEGIYGRKDRFYGNWMARILTPSAAATIGGEARPEPVSMVAYPNPAYQYIRLRFTLERPGGYTFLIADAAGRAVGTLLERKCRAGLNEITFNTASLAPGTYLLRAVTADGAVIEAERFTKQ